MGFGTLFFGYFIMFAFSLSSMYFFADIIGAVVTIYAFSKLAEYNKYFNIAMLAALLFALCSAVNAANMILGLYQTSGIAAQTVSIMRSLFASAIHVFMFLGARGIALGARAEKIAKTAERDMVMIVIYYAAYIIVTSVNGIREDILEYFNMFVLIYWLVCFVLNMVFIYKCFAVLVPEDEDENVKKRSRFAFINKLDDKMDEFEKNRQEYRLESVRLAQEEAEKLSLEKRKHKKKHKKKK